ncbi:MAG: adenylate/guanylate cyclase domain-containing protein [Candidatus Eisenbacteria bacterium]
MLKRFLHGSLLGGGAAAVALALWGAGALDRWEDTTWAWRVRHFARPSAATESIKIILLDQESLDWGRDQNGWSWPWPREVYGPIIDFCRRGGARTIAFDVLYTEPSLYGVSDDEALGAAAGRGADFIGALFLTDEQAGESAWPPEVPRPDWNFTGLPGKGDEGPARIRSAAAAHFPVPEVAGAAAILANVSDRPDEDGVFRRASLLREFDGRPIPSLGLAAYLHGRAELRAPGALRVEEDRLLLGPLPVPIDAKGRSILRFPGPTGTYPAVSAASVIQSELRMLGGEEPVLDPAFFRGAHVFFGFSAPGLLDLRPTPLSRVGPGVEIHATVLDNLLTGGFLREPPRLLTILATLLLALLASTLVVSTRRAWLSALVLLLLLPVPALLGLAGYGPGYWWPIVVGELAVALSLVGAIVLNYATEGRQKQFIKQAFKFYLSPEVIERILKDPSQLRLGGDRRELTILFSDIEGFTSISEKLDPAGLTALLNDYLSDMTDIVLDEGGTLDKYVGDAFIAFWNAPLGQPDHGERAARAAWRCQRRLAQRREEFRSRTGAELRMRIGIHTGEAVVGNMGSKQRFNYTVLGDAANLASRLEGANKVFGTYTMLSESTRDRAGGAIRAREIGRLRVVGRRTPVLVYELCGMAGDPAPARHEAFERGLRLCYDGATRDALAVFDEIPDDPVSRAYARRCRSLLTEPGAAWDGIWNLTEK